MLEILIKEAFQLVKEKASVMEVSIDCIVEGISSQHRGQCIVSPRCIQFKELVYDNTAKKYDERPISKKEFEDKLNNSTAVCIKPIKM